jgi:TonB family protein
MRKTMVVVVAALAALLTGWDAPAAPSSGRAVPDTAHAGLSGTYLINSAPASRAVISSFQPRLLCVAVLGDSSYWSTGYWDGVCYVGVLAGPEGSVSRGDSCGFAWLSFTRGKDGELKVERWWPPRDHDVHHEVWTHVSDLPPGLADSMWARKRDNDLPRFGEYVELEELPEAIEKVPPAYPEWARQKDTEGTVIVQALIGRDGRVKDTKVTHSIPDLDDYAVAAVKQWRFHPAKYKGRPVAVWVAVPVKFSLH